MDRPGVTSTILGARTSDQLEDNLGSLDVALDSDQRARLDAASEIDLGFPHDMLMSPRIKGFLHGGVEIEPYGA
jgi:diketogulonate reductase-like aldo/keto reductase